MRRRSAFTLFQLLTVLAILAFGFALFMPGIAKMRMMAARAQGQNNIKQIVLATINHADANSTVMPSGVDDNGFSASAKLLPYMDQGGVYKTIDFKKSVTDEANAAARKTVISIFLDPRDPIKSVRDDSGATNYLFNDKVFYRNSKLNYPRSIPDGTSNTIFIGETLKGDGGAKAEDVKRQYVLLKKENLKEVTARTGARYWKDNKNIAGDRCASWMDGRFLQGTFNGKLKLNDQRPDVSCGGEAGVSTLRSLNDEIAVGMGDGSSRFINAKKLTFTTWTFALDPDDGMPLGPDW
jgi:hypothetical protein